MAADTASPGLLDDVVGPRGSKDPTLSRSSRIDPLGGLAPDARNRRDERDIALGNRLHQHGQLGATEDAQRGLGPDAFDADQQAEEAELVVRRETVQPYRVGADARVHVERDLRLCDACSVVMVRRWQNTS